MVFTLFDLFIKPGEGVGDTGNVTRVSGNVHVHVLLCSQMPIQVVIN